MKKLEVVAGIFGITLIGVSPGFILAGLSSNQDSPNIERNQLNEETKVIETIRNPSGGYIQILCEMREEVSACNDDRLLKYISDRVENGEVSGLLASITLNSNLDKGTWGRTISPKEATLGSDIKIEISQETTNEDRKYPDLEFGFEVIKHEITHVNNTYKSAEIRSQLHKTEAHHDIEERDDGWVCLYKYGEKSDRPSFSRCIYPDVNN